MKSSLKRSESKKRVLCKNTSAHLQKQSLQGSSDLFSKWRESNDKIPRLSIQRRLHLQRVLRDSITSKQETKRICDTIDQKKRLLKREFVLGEYSRHGFNRHLGFRQHIFNSCNQNNLSHIRYKQMIRKNKRKTFRQSGSQAQRLLARARPEEPPSLEPLRRKNNAAQYKQILNELVSDNAQKRRRIQKIRNNLAFRKKVSQNERSKRSLMKSISLGRFERELSTSTRRPERAPKRGGLCGARGGRQATFSSMGSNVLREGIGVRLEKEELMRSCLEEKLKQVKKDIHLIQKKIRVIKKVEKVQQFNEKITNFEIFRQKVGV